MVGVAEERTVYRTCPLCEATCGLELTVRDGEVLRVRGDRDDVFSRGFICPKGSVLGQLHADPDRLRAPLVRRNGRHEVVTWDEAWRAVAEGLGGVVERHGRERLAVYLGNPNAHNLSPLLYNRTWVRALRTRQRYSASSVDQLPKQLSSGWMFGSPTSVAVPDLDRTDYLLILGANPMASNGSLCTAPDFPGRLKAIRDRGGRVVVVDPARTRTAEEADEWVAIRPGTDALLLAAIAHELFVTGRADLGDHLRPYVSGMEVLAGALAPFEADAVSAATGVPAATIRRLASELASAPSAAVYGRMGTTTVSFGTTASWLVDVLNVVTGNLDRAGGAMFPLPATGGPTSRGEAGRGKGFRTGRSRSVVRGFPEILGEYPVALMAEEIEHSEGVRALVTVAGNPVLSTPNGARLSAALGRLDFMVSVDPYLNETTRHADVILPPPSHLERSHYDLVFTGFSVRNTANYSPAVFERAEGQPDEWEILLRIGAIVGGIDLEPAAIDDVVVRGAIESMCGDASSSVHGRSPDEIVAALEPRRGPERMLDLLLRTGPYGDGFGTRPRGLSLAALEEAPHGVDLGPLQPRMPGMLRTASGTIELAPEQLLADLPRLYALIDAPVPPLVLVGRRHLRSNNSWMHNVASLVRGRPRCTLQVHPDDATKCGVHDGGTARVASRVGEVLARVEVTDSVSRGVVSLPHGWGHDVDGVRLGVAREFAGVNSNLLTDEEQMDPLSGNAVLNGIPVTVAPAR
jgi:anaerobic selenocysteine-containing dehydrogenase